MEEKETKKEEKKDATSTEEVAKEKEGSDKKTPDVKSAAGPRERRSGQSSFKKNTRRSSRRERPRSEFDQAIIEIRRVTRVVAGGRRFSFSVAMVAGNKKGSVGVGLGKASDTALAIDKATRDAKKNMIKVRTTKEMSIPHDVEAKYNASVVRISPSPGRGLIAGSSVRNVLELAGLKDVSAKIFSRSRNKLNNARAAVKALVELS